MAAAAGQALARQKFVTPVDVCLGIGWLNSSNVDSWRHGRVPSLEYFLPVQDDKLTQFFEYLRSWADAEGLEPGEADYVSATRDRRPLHFTAAAVPETERAWRTRWIPADLPVASRERIVQRQEKPPDLVVVLPVKDWDCAECGGTGDLLIMDDAGSLCMTCADMDHPAVPPLPARPGRGHRPSHGPARQRPGRPFRRRARSRRAGPHPGRGRPGPPPGHRL